MPSEGRHLRDGGFSPSSSKFRRPRGSARFPSGFWEENFCPAKITAAKKPPNRGGGRGESRRREGPTVGGAGTRPHDNAITKPMSSALLNRMFHVELRVDSRLWLEWAAAHGIHPWVYDYICARPDQL